MNLKETYRRVFNTAREVYDEYEARGIANLVMSDLGFERIDVLRDPDREINRAQMNRMNDILQKLNQKIPLQYILGYAWFLDLKISLNSYVLIPRRETEEMTDLIIKEQRKSNLNVLDVGTGSGCIALSLAHYLPRPVVYACDLSINALEQAKENARRLNLDIHWIHDDILNPVHQKYPESYDLIVSNPPYVKESEKAEMHENVLSHEPPSALFVSDSDPLLYYRALAQFSRQHLSRKGSIYLEINENLGQETLNLFNDKIYTERKLIKDMQGKDRFIKITRV